MTRLRIWSRILVKTDLSGGERAGGIKTSNMDDAKLMKLASDSTEPYKSLLIELFERRQAERVTKDWLGYVLDFTAKAIGSNVVEYAAPDEAEEAEKPSH